MLWGTAVTRGLCAVQLLDARLVVVLGHSRCMTVASAVQRWAQHPDRQTAPAAVASLAGLKPMPEAHPLGTSSGGPASKARLPRFAGCRD